MENNTIVTKNSNNTPPVNISPLTILARQDVIQQQQKLIQWGRNLFIIPSPTKEDKSDSEDEIIKDLDKEFRRQPKTGSRVRYSSHISSYTIKLDYYTILILSYI